MIENRNSYLMIGAVALVVIVIAGVIGVQLIQSQNTFKPGGNNQACTMEAKICPDGTAVGRSGPNCEFSACPVVTATSAKDAFCTPANLTIQQPASGTQVKFPLTVSGVVDNRKNKDCTWTVFEGQAGTIEVKDEKGTLVGSGVLSASGDWTTDAAIRVEGTVELSGKPVGRGLMVVVTEEDPSGNGKSQQVTTNVTY